MGSGRFIHEFSLYVFQFLFTHKCGVGKRRNCFVLIHSSVLLIDCVRISPENRDKWNRTQRASTCFLSFNIFSSLFCVEECSIRAKSKHFGNKEKKHSTANSKEYKIRNRLTCQQEIIADYLMLYWQTSNQSVNPLSIHRILFFCSNELNKFP